MHTYIHLPQYQLHMSVPMTLRYIKLHIFVYWQLFYLQVSAIRSGAVQFLYVW